MQNLFTYKTSLMAFYGFLGFVIEMTSNDSNEVIANIEMRRAVEDFEIIRLVLAGLQILIPNDSESAAIRKS